MQIIVDSRSLARLSPIRLSRIGGIVRAADETCLVVDIEPTGTDKGVTKLGKDSYQTSQQAELTSSCLARSQRRKINEQARKRRVTSQGAPIMHADGRPPQQREFQRMVLLRDPRLGDEAQSGSTVEVVDWTSLYVRRILTSTQHRRDARYHCGGDVPDMTRSRTVNMATEARPQLLLPSAAWLYQPLHHLRCFEFIGSGPTGTTNGGWCAKIAIACWARHL